MIIYKTEGLDTTAKQQGALRAPALRFCLVISQAVSADVASSPNAGSLVWVAGPTNPSGLISFSNFTINGPAGVYTVVPSAEGVDSTQAGRSHEHLAGWHDRPPPPILSSCDGATLHE